MQGLEKLTFVIDEFSAGDDFNKNYEQFRTYFRRGRSNRKETIMRLAPIKWPNNAKIAVSFFVAFEAFEKSSQYRRSEGKPDYASLAYGEYGGKAGIWRIMDALGRNGVKGTIDTNGRIAEDFPDALKELHAGGHEIVGHGWVNDTALSSLDAASERALIKRTLDAIASVTGKRPVGWVSPGPSRQRLHLRKLCRRRYFLDR